MLIKCLIEITESFKTANLFKSSHFAQAHMDFL